MNLTIGISKGSGSPKFLNYWRWLQGAGTDVTVVDLSASDDIAKDMAAIDALVLTGGSDIEPSRYGHGELEDRCEDIDRERDAREFRMLDIAGERELPVLGICRGLQVLNVHRGGTLIAHLPDRVAGSEKHQKDGDSDRRHTIEVTPGTLLFKASGELTGEVNSAHHQAIDTLAEGLMVAARSDDGVIEAIELGNKVGSPYLVA
ncbi:MAG: gamma-glutamyl-gamma-aminobutyrate hydrolase family protein, partial [bacterium]|nr:gamma-glutamyl-gamma-aminobutyrate hydrolase family protein [Candidatus Kapabacteria bacterium]